MLRCLIAVVVVIPSIAQAQNLTICGQPAPKQLTLLMYQPAVGGKCDCIPVGARNALKVIMVLNGGEYVGSAMVGGKPMNLRMKPSDKPDTQFGSTLSLEWGDLKFTAITVESCSFPPAKMSWIWHPVISSKTNGCKVASVDIHIKE